MSYERKRNVTRERSYDAAKHAARSAYLREYKRSAGCADCGYREHTEALSFDHLPGVDKLFNVGQYGNRRWEDVLAEIEKCEVVCANCHAVRTAERRK